MTAPESRESLKTFSQLDALDRSRRHMLTAVVATSTLWILPQILQGVLYETLPHIVNSILVIAGMTGGLAWMAFMFRYHRFQMRVLGDPELKKRLDDERITQIRREAIYRGWFVLVVAVAIGVFVAPFAELPDQAVLLSLMLLGVNAPIVFFLVMDRG